MGCSPIKAVRELGSERRETVRSLSGAGAGRLRGSVPSTRGPGWTDHWWTCWVPNPWQGSQVREGETLKASKREARPKMRRPRKAYLPKDPSKTTR